MASTEREAGDARPTSSPSPAPPTGDTMTDEVVAALLAAPARLPRTRLLALDGPAGSGKTTLAAAVHRRLADSGRSVVTVHLDDLYDGWTGLDLALDERVSRQLLEPLAAGRSAWWQQYDWYAGRFDRWHELAAPDVLVLEGCGSGAARHAAYTSLLVWLEAPRDTRIARGIARDGAQVRAHWMAWMRSEEVHFARNRTAERADLVYRTG